MEGDKTFDLIKGLLDERPDAVAMRVSDWTYRDLCRKLGVEPYNDPLKKWMPTTYFMGRAFIVDKKPKRGEIFLMDNGDVYEYYNRSNER